MDKCVISNVLRRHAAVAMSVLSVVFLSWLTWQVGHSGAVMCNEYDEDTKEVVGGTIEAMDKYTYQMSEQSGAETRYKMLIHPDKRFLDRGAKKLVEVSNVEWRAYVEHDLGDHVAFKVPKSRIYKKYTPPVYKLACGIALMFASVVIALFDLIVLVNVIGCHWNMMFRDIDDGKPVTRSWLTHTFD